mmetsp:Transcript_1692/g.3948  ORF Transcript_1692/g.3948 Transcript_1692/m.3948 type:complete len:245 (-) Transcript_1692:613-1347(-)
MKAPQSQAAQGGRGSVRPRRCVPNLQALEAFAVLQQVPKHLVRQPHRGAEKAMPPEGKLLQLRTLGDAGEAFLSLHQAGQCQDPQLWAGKGNSVQTRVQHGHAVKRQLLEQGAACCDWVQDVSRRYTGQRVRVVSESKKPRPLGLERWRGHYSLQLINIALYRQHPQVRAAGTHRSQKTTKEVGVDIVRLWRNADADLLDFVPAAVEEPIPEAFLVLKHLRQLSLPHAHVPEHDPAELLSMQGF